MVTIRNGVMCCRIGLIKTIGVYIRAINSRSTWNLRHERSLRIVNLITVDQSDRHSSKKVGKTRRTWKKCDKLRVSIIGITPVQSTELYYQESCAEVVLAGQTS